MNPTSKNINDALAAIERTELADNHPRKLAQRALARYRRGQAIDPDYDFSAAPRELRQVVYDGIVKYGAQYSWLARLRRR